MATASPHPDGHSGLFDLDGDYPPNPELFGAPTEPDNQEEPNERDNQTIFMTVFFLVLMILYVGFCAWYRKGKTRRTVGDDGTDSERNERRSRQRRENQAVLDESASAATRARENAEEQRKLEERKENIKKSLWLRLIVDDAEAAEDSDEEEKVEGEVHAKFTADAPPKRGITTIQEEDDDEENVLCQIASEEAAEAVANANGKDDIEGQSLAIEKNGTATTTGTDDSSPAPSPTQAPQAAPASPSRMSLPSPRKYADALNCGSNVRHAMATCSSQGVSCSNANGANCGGIPCGSLHNSIHSKLRGIGDENVGDNDCPTISLSAIVDSYGEECHVCLSQFQVGDRAAWSKHGSDRGSNKEDNGCSGNRTIGMGTPADDAGGTNGGDEDESDDGKNEGCRHIFHEECISRWLLVRDGCPICRRSYLQEDTATNTAGDVERGE